VGKSTFINAFVNYLTFDTLEDAKQHDDLTWVIPSSFSTQTMDREGPDGEIIETEIKVGSRSDENDGSKGASATQQTIVHVSQTYFVASSYLALRRAIHKVGRNRICHDQINRHPGNWGHAGHRV
jgi:hypothetical protein